MALVDPGYAVPYFVIGVFMLPLVAALFFGRVFCSGVCPLGAIQELVLIKPIEVPLRLDKALGSLKWVYLVAALILALAPAASRDFIICRFDPFVGFFRFSGPVHMMLLGAGFLLLGLFVIAGSMAWADMLPVMSGLFKRALPLSTWQPAISTQRPSAWRRRWL